MRELASCSCDAERIVTKEYIKKHGLLGLNIGHCGFEKYMRWKRRLRIDRMQTMKREMARYYN